MFLFGFSSWWVDIKDFFSSFDGFLLAIFFFILSVYLLYRRSVLLTINKHLSENLDLHSNGSKKFVSNFSIFDASFCLANNIFFNYPAGYVGKDICDIINFFIDNQYIDLNFTGCLVRNVSDNSRRDSRALDMFQVLSDFSISNRDSNDLSNAYSFAIRFEGFAPSDGPIIRPDHVMDYLSCLSRGKDYVDFFSCGVLEDTSSGEIKIFIDITVEPLELVYQSHILNSRYSRDSISPNLYF